MNQHFGVRVGGGLRMLVTVACFTLAAPVSASFVTFESGQVRPLALSPDGSHLFAVNTPDGRLEIFAVGGNGLSRAGAVSVGMEPVAVAARTNTEVWVVNHLSDSVSIVDLSGGSPRVVRTLLVGDEPRDIVFGGASKDRAFITTAHRGQNTPLQDTINDVMRTEGIGRADVWVFDANDLGASMGGDPLTILTLFGDTPRALAVTPDGSTVYAAIFHSGNQTTAINETIVCDGGSSAPPCFFDGVTVPGGLPGGQMPGGLPAPNANIEGTPNPEVGLVVKFNRTNGLWEDELARNWTNAVRFNLPDLDVFAIDADADPPVQTASFAHVGTVLFNMIVNPSNAKVYVTNTDARNEVRFEGDRTAPNTTGATTVRGHLHEARVTVLDGSSVLPRHLNKHINYSLASQPAGVADNSLATPVGMAVSSDGTTLYVAAFGSSKIGVFDTAQLENDSFTPSASSHIDVPGGGPSGLVLDEIHDRLYVLTRFDNSVSVIDLQDNSERAHLALFNPEPPQVVNGRAFLYDARFTSSNGEASCSSCHVFADFDSLGWDLGNPDDVVRNNPNPQSVVPAQFNVHPMKGPMTTQTLRGMANNGPMHWRGDRTGAFDAPNIEPDSGGFDEHAAFRAFNVAFNGLLGRDQGEIPEVDMQAFADFILEVTLPPNPIRELNNQLTDAQQRGSDFYFGPVSDIVTNCNGCHELTPAAGFFGTDGRSSFEAETQDFKIPHLRNGYQKVGMFGMPAVFGGGGGNAHTGDQVRGFGFLHDGSVDTNFRFHNAGVFSFNNDDERRDMEAFMLAFDSNLAPIVGQQVTLTSGNAGTVAARLNLLIARSAVGECDLIVKGVIDGEARGWLRTGTGEFRSDHSVEPLLSDANLRSLATTAGQELTYTCVPPGSGQRVGIDRDEDGILDRDEGLCAAAPAPSCRAAGKSTLQIKTQAGREKIGWKWRKGDTVLNDFGDPVAADTGYSLCIYTGTANGLIMEVEVPPQGICDGGPCWSATGAGFKYKDRSLGNDGAHAIQLKAGGQGKAKILVKGKGENLPVPVFPDAGVPLPVTAQLTNTAGECWEATYAAPTTNDASGFKAKTP